MSRFGLDGNYEGGGFKIEYIEYIVANDLDFGPNDQAQYENDYDGDVPQVTYMPYVFMMQDTYAKRQEEEQKKAKVFSAVFTPIDKLIMDYLNSKQNGKPYIEGDADRKAIQNLRGFSDLNNTFHDHIGKDFFDYIKRPSSEGPSKRISSDSTKSKQTVYDKSANLKQYIDRQVANSDRSSSVVMGSIDPEYNRSTALAAAAGGGHRRSHKPSQKKTGKGKSRSRSRSRSRSKTRSKSKSKSKTRAKSKSKRR